MKSIIFAAALMFSSVSSASLVYSDGFVQDLDLGGFDTLLFSTRLKDSSTATETQSLADFLFVDPNTLVMHSEDVTKGQASNGNYWIQNGDELTFDFGDDFDADFYMLKLGVGKKGDTHYFFDNHIDLQFALIDLTTMFEYDNNRLEADRFKVDRISHIAYVLDTTTTTTTTRVLEPPTNVPEPSIIGLMGIGLLGMGFLARRMDS